MFSRVLRLKNSLISNQSHIRKFCKSQTHLDLKRTCLYDFHVHNEGKIVPFAGWEMPVQYKSGITSEHLHVRSDAGLFDVSHMLQTKITGEDSIKFIESMTVADVEGLKENQGTLSVFTNDTGGILDDLIINKTTDGYLYVVSNAGCAEKDLRNMLTQAELFRNAGGDVDVEIICNGLLALQGPSAGKVMQEAVDFDMNTLPFMTNKQCSVYGISDCRVTRCGYTGEDGVEISVPSDKSVELAIRLMNSKAGNVKLIGLGARDSLRLEAGLCLYGNDITETTSPVEATLMWTIGKRRRQDADFPGAEVILEQIKQKPTRKRIGIISEGPPARGGTKIYNESGTTQIGELTSGCPSPSLKKNVSMGYVETPFSKVGTGVQLEVRKKMVPATVSKMPFLKCNYFTG
ncbi:aminomethyltransferase, mitochondrial-like isoform X1 [Mytilus trossulus]|uniref:aminomethyltransferase, mitochondrial-like isoform X1 n=2 Tax=Mytilus trossulus TaxID=6551 RepID=UPI0030049B06